MNKRTKGIAVGALAALALSAATLAGSKQNMSVTIWPGAFLDVAYGFLGTARNSADIVQQIGCFSSGGSASCSATTAAGQSVSCSTSAASHLAAIHSMTNDSYLLFGWDNSTGVCEFVYVRNMSYTPPKAP
ncbi:MAG TPA: hypothetical protein VFS58_10885 [Steroidobacteraceae bacterium]|nr:hypothetical protein [Steroidobacteraceae bacterium]